MQIIDNITLSKVNAGIAINLIYSDEDVSYDSIKKVILERYIIPKTKEYLNNLKKAIYYQTVSQYLGSKTAFISKVFGFGGGDIGITPSIIDITYAWNNEFPKIVDSNIDTDNNMYLYRIITYGTPDFEKATVYVSGLDEYVSELYNDSYKDAKYIQFLDFKDLELLVPNNVEGLKKWILNNNLFHETYRLRYRGEHESFKFSTYWQRAWLALHLINTITDINDTLIESVIGDINGFHT